LIDRAGIHGDLGAYLLGVLDEDERDRFVAHLSGCEQCRAEAADLEGALGLLARSAPPVAPPPALEARTLGAIRANGGGTRAEPQRRRRLAWPRLALGGAMALALAAAVLAGTRLDGGVPGSLELEAILTSPSGETQATASVRKTGIGRVVELRTDELPILPEGQYYELWFVGPGDRPGSPERISAGTFHPDPEGRSNVRFAAAVDPRRYPELAITREPGDGDPSPSRDVLRTHP
jgi:anti-sigma-K factor RskA